MLAGQFKKRVLGKCANISFPQYTRPHVSHVSVAGYVSLSENQFLSVHGFLFSLYSYFLYATPKCTAFLFATLERGGEC